MHYLREFTCKRDITLAIIKFVVGFGTSILREYFCCKYSYSSFPIIYYFLLVLRNYCTSSNNFMLLDRTNLIWKKQFKVSLVFFAVSMEEFHKKPRYLKYVRREVGFIYERPYFSHVKFYWDSSPAYKNKEKPSKMRR